MHELLDDLVEALADQQRLGVLGTSPAEAIAHSDRFVAALADAGRVLDLGSGAGVPGLVIAVRRPSLRVTLLDARERRTDRLARIVHRLGLTDRVEVVCARADAAARQADLAGSFEAVTARSFGGPVAVLTASRPFLAVGGRLVVSDPPAAGARWSIDEVVRAGFRPLARTDASPGIFIAEAI
jgi:16S rRNA G527 N7-methylase RsmG